MLRDARGYRGHQIVGKINQMFRKVSCKYKWVKLTLPWNGTTRKMFKYAINKKSVQIQACQSLHFLVNTKNIGQPWTN